MENEFEPLKPLLPHWLQTSLTVAFWVLIVAFLVTYGPQALLDLYEVLQ